MASVRFTDARELLFSFIIWGKKIDIYFEGNLIWEYDKYSNAHDIVFLNQFLIWFSNLKFKLRIFYLKAVICLIEENNTI